MTGSVTGIRRRRGVAGRRETPHLPLDRDFYGQTLNTSSYSLCPFDIEGQFDHVIIARDSARVRARGKVVPIMVSFRKSLGTSRKLVPTHHLLCLLWVRPYPKANLGMVWVRFRLFISHQQHPTAITAHPRKTKNPRIYGVFLEMFGGQGRDRTGDTRIFSPLLYQLSYLATAF